MLECVVSGYPDPDVFWYWRDPVNPLGDSTKYEVEKLISHGSAYLKWDDRIFTLTIRIVTTGDFGNYTCAAKNAHGVASTSIELFCTRLSLSSLSLLTPLSHCSLLTCFLLAAGCFLHIDFGVIYTFIYSLFF